MKKLVPLLIALLGLVLVIAAFVVWLEPPKEGGVLSVAGGIISFLLGAGASIKGWMDVFKKDTPAKSDTSYTATQKGDGAVAQGDHSRAVGEQGVMAEEVKGIINYGTIKPLPLLLHHHQSLITNHQTLLSLNSPISSDAPKNLK